MGVHNYQLSTNVSADCQLTTNFLANCQLTTKFSSSLSFILQRKILHHIWNFLPFSFFLSFILFSV